MQQLTSLDAQFLAFETPRAFGHVGGLAVYDLRTAPGGTLTADDILRGSSRGRWTARGRCGRSI